MKLGIVPAQIASSEEIASRLAKGKSLPVLPGFKVWTGVIDRTGKVQSNDKELIQLFARMDEQTLSADDIPDNGIPVAVLVRTPWTVDAEKKYLEKIVDHFKINVEIPKRKHRTLQASETVAWPFLQGLIAGRPPMKINGSLAHGARKLPSYELVLPENSKHLSGRLKKVIAPLSERLTAVDVAKLHYSGQTEWKETLATLFISTVFGAGGDFVVNRIFPDDISHHNLVAYVAQSGSKLLLLVLTDTLDGSIGEWETNRGNSLANGMSFSLKSLTGSKHMRDVVMNLFNGLDAFKEEGRVIAKRALGAGIKGAVAGVPFAAAITMILSMHGLNPAIEAPVAGVLSTSFELSLLFNLREVKKLVQAAILEQIDNGKIPTPENGFPDDATKMRYVEEIALQELISRSSNSAAAKAAVMAPTINGVGLASGLVVPRGLAEAFFMGTAPPMENISKFGQTVWQEKVERPRAMDKARDLVLATPNGFTEAAHDTALERAFAGYWPRQIANVITLGTPPRRLPLRQAGTEENTTA